MGFVVWLECKTCGEQMPSFEKKPISSKLYIDFPGINQGFVESLLGKNGRTIVRKIRWRFRMRRVTSKEKAGLYSFLAWVEKYPFAILRGSK